MCVCVCAVNLAYLAVSVLNGGYVRLAEGALDEAEDERRFADTASTEDDHSVVVALFRHAADDNVDVTYGTDGGTIDQHSF